MKCLIVKVKDRKRTPTYKKMISGKDVYSFPSNLDDAIEYSSSTLHEENEWYMITSFSKTTLRTGGSFMPSGKKRRMKSLCF